MQSRQCTSEEKLYMQLDPACPKQSSNVLATQLAQLSAPLHILLCPSTWLSTVEQTQRLKAVYPVYPGQLSQC